MPEQSSKLTIDRVNSLTQLNAPVWNDTSTIPQYETPVKGFVIYSSGTLLYWNGTQWKGI